MEKNAVRVHSSILIRININHQESQWACYRTETGLKTSFMVIQRLCNLIIFTDGSVKRRVKNDWGFNCIPKWQKCSRSGTFQYNRECKDEGRGSYFDK